MAFEKEVMVMLFLFTAAAVQVAMATVYKVGDSAGWTTIDSPDYKKWAASKTFRVGDIILFEYNAQFHNVMQVNHADYSSCNVSAPITTHTSGNNSITIKKTGHYYYVCGIPGHCQAGQKVDIRVLATTSPSPSPSSMAPSPAIDDLSPPTSPMGSTAPTPSPGNSASLRTNTVSSLVTALCLAVFAGFGF